jgi:large repetitive protein
MRPIHRVPARTRAHGGGRTARRLVAALVAVVAPISLAAATPAAAQTAPGGTPVVLPGSAEVLEGDEGTTTLSVPVVLSEATDAEVTVEWSTIRPSGAPLNQAAPGRDYVAASGTVTIAPGEQTGTASIEVIGNTVAQPDRYVVISFTNPTNARMGGFWGLGFGLILDDDGPAVNPGAGEVLEGNDGLTALAIPVSLSEPVDREVTVDWETIVPPDAPPVKAGAGTDYVPASGTVTFAPGQTEATVTIDVIGNTIPQPDRYVVVSFRNPSGAFMSGFWGLGFGLIVDDDVPTVLPGTAEVAEGDEGLTPLELPVRLSQPSWEPVRVEWATISPAGAPAGQAVPGVDYEAASGTVTFAPGETEATVTINVIGNVEPQGDRYIPVSFRNPTNAVMGGFWGLGFGLVIDDDDEPGEDPGDPVDPGEDPGDPVDPGEDPADPGEDPVDPVDPGEGDDTDDDTDDTDDDDDEDEEDEDDEEEDLTELT